MTAEILERRLEADRRYARAFRGAFEDGVTGQNAARAPLGLSDRERRELAAFLRALSGTVTEGAT